MIETLTSHPKTVKILKLKMIHKAYQTVSTEFIIIMASLMSLLALSIDSMLPALNLIGNSLGVSNPNDNQLIISSMFLGMAMGLMLYGPLSDSFGRKKALYLGVFIFLIGDLISLLANDFTFMIIGRLCQGFGAASCRVVTTAMIRDRFEGKEMAKIMSLIMLVFIMVPVLAPALGQLILVFYPWPAIFILLFVFALTSIIWLGLRQPETLDVEKRIDFSLGNVWAGIKETLSTPVSRAYTLAGGFIFGAFIGYLSCVQQILQIQYELGSAFSFYFGALALAIGLASFANSKLVMKFKIPTLCIAALCVFVAASFIFTLFTYYYDGHPALPFLLAYLALVFFCFGFVLGNFSTLALYSLGHIAGVANSVISTIRTLISVVVGGMIGQLYDGTVQPLVIGFLLCSLISLIIVVSINKKHSHV